MWGKGIADAAMAAFIAGCVISAFVGWAVIEGAIWIASHITIGWS